MWARQTGRLPRIARSASNSPSHTPWTWRSARVRSTSGTRASIPLRCRAKEGRGSAAPAALLTARTAARTARHRTRPWPTTAPTRPQRLGLTPIPAPPTRRPRQLLTPANAQRRRRRADPRRSRRSWTTTATTPPRHQSRCRVRRVVRRRPLHLHLRDAAVPHPVTAPGLPARRPAGHDRCRRRRHL